MSTCASSATHQLTLLRLLRLLTRLTYITYSTYNTHTHTHTHTHIGSVTLGACPAANRSYAVYGPQAYLPPCKEDLTLVLDKKGDMVPKNICPSIAGGITADVSIIVHICAYYCAYIYIYVSTLLYSVWCRICNYTAGHVSLNCLRAFFGAFCALPRTFTRTASQESSPTPLPLSHPLFLPLSFLASPFFRALTNMA